MKIRNGFVSNSSSCSFCIYGTYIEDKDLIKKIDDGIFDKELSKEKIQTYCMDFVDGIYIGRELTTMPDNQTMGEFKKQVSEALCSIFNIEDDFCFFEESWYDG
jgi:hypothetical protein